MFYKIIQNKVDKWYQSDECKIKNIINYIINQGNLRDAQIEAIKLYLFFKIYCKNKSLVELFCKGYFLENMDLDDLVSKNLGTFLKENSAARQLYELTLTDKNYDSLKKIIEKNYKEINFEEVFNSFFNNISYTNYIYSLPMGAGKTYLMSAFIYLDLYFALNEPNNKSFAHNFIILVPSGLKSSIMPSLKKIKDFDVSWIFPEPIASTLKSKLKFEILDAIKTENKSNKIKNPNVAKIAAYQPYEDILGVVFLTNAEKVILNKIEKNNMLKLIQIDNETRAANELRETIGKIPNKAIFIDEVHHTASEDIKLNKVIKEWYNKGNINEVVGFSGTPYYDKAETFEIKSKFTKENIITIKSTDMTNTVYHYPLTNGINNFLKKPKIYSSSDNNPLNIVKEGLIKFFEKYENTYYKGIVSKVAIYCGNIENLEEKIYPFVSEFVAKKGLNPNEVILKYHGGNKKYSLPKENELEFLSLNTALSKKRIILLVGIGKEGWDCSSLTGVILSQKGDCPTKMVLQTACRCLRQVIKGEKETAIIYLNKENEKLLSSQLNKTQNATLQDFQNGTKTEDTINRYSRMKYLNIPNIEYYKLNIKYTEEIEEKMDTEKNLQNLLLSKQIKEDIIIKEINLKGEVIERNINSIIYGEKVNYTSWLLNISKESFGFITLKKLREYDKDLREIYKKITIDENILNNIYNHSLINKLIREAFYNKRSLNILREEIPENASILSITELPAIKCEDKNLQYPSDILTEKILDKDKGNKDINLDELSKEELLKLLKTPEYLKYLSDEDVKELRAKDKTFHYIPYVFTQSSFEKEILEKILSMGNFISDNLEVYYNGDRNIAPFRIECYKKEKERIKKIGLYTPDFLIIKREKNMINKVLIVETKGKGFSTQQEFLDRRNYVENDFIKFNNKKYGYSKFDYLYIEDTLKDNDIIEKLNEKIKNFFKEEK